jgi:2-keto-4-pentenoate hydratase/2-oxohepta-3-ene-1,7-dioic acid hydratase in catechol pathway
MLGAVNLKFATFCSGTRTAPAVLLNDEQLLDIAAATASAHHPITSVQTLIAGGNGAIQTIRELLQRTRHGKLGRAVLGIADVEMLAPLPRPNKNIFCVGRNYHEHLVEGARSRGVKLNIPEYPVFFTKPPTTVSGPGAVFALDPKVTAMLDYEVELGVVIGTSGRNIREDLALNHVFGYTIVNDISARDLQFRHEQWFKGKSLDGACPMGPWIVHKSAIADPQALDISLTVNGEERQKSNTSLMIFSIRRIISVLSEGLTLEPGDVISTGTPAGVGFGMQPQRYLTFGDVVECRIESIGSLVTRIGRAA